MSDSLSPDHNAEDFFNQALEHLDQSDYSAVIACCDQAITLNPNYSDAWWVKGQVLQHLAEDEAALECFDQVIALEPEFYSVWERRSLTLINLERREEALEAVNRAIALMPEDCQDWLPYFNQGRWLSMLKQPDEATLSFRKAAAIASAVNPPDPDDLSVVWSTLGNHHTLLNQYEQAIAAYENAPFVRTDAEEMWLYALMQLGRQDQILARYNHLVEAEPDSDVAWKRRGLAMRKLGRLEEAIDSYKRSVALNPVSTDWYHLRQALKQLGRQAEIIDHYRDILAIYPDQAELWSSQAYSLSQLGRQEEALASYEQAIKLNCKDDYAWHGCAILLQEFGRIEEAIAAYRQAATIASEVDPMANRVIDYWCDLGNLLFSMERYEAAIECYDNSPFPRYDAEINRIEALKSLGRLEDVVAQFDRQLKEYPDDAQMWLDRGRVLEELGQLEAALDSYNQVFVIDPTHWNALLGCSYVLFDLERDEEVITVLDRLIELNPNYANAYYNKARCYVYLNQFDAVLENLQRAIELDATCRESAAADEAFIPLRENEQFKQIIEG